MKKVLVWLFAVLTALSVAACGDKAPAPSGELTLDSLSGAVVGVIGKGQTPDLVFRYILEQNGMEYVVSDMAQPGKVAIRYYSAGSDVVMGIKAGQLTYGLFAEPLVTNAIATLQQSDSGMQTAASVKAAAAVASDEQPGTTEKLKVFAPDGAPAFALSGLMGDDTYDIEVVASNTIASKITSGDADLVIAPTNAVVNLFNKGQDYRIVAQATRGNLFIVGSNGMLDVQALYEAAEEGNTYGFPQAVLAVKYSTYTARKTEVDAFLTAYAAAEDYAEEHPAEAVERVKNHMSDGVEASIQQMSAETAARCNISGSVLTEADKADINGYIQMILDLEAEGVADGSLASSVGGKLPDEQIYLVS